MWSEIRNSKDGDNFFGNRLRSFLVHPVGLTDFDDGVNPVSRVAVYTFLQPIFGVFLSLTLVDRGSEAPLLRYAAALVLICVSIAVVNRGQRQEG